MIAAVVINYRNEDKTIAFVRDEMVKISSEHAVVIVDNGSTAESEKALKDAFSDVSDRVVVVPSSENLGFAKGNNLGAELARDRFDPKYLLFANNDIRLQDADAVDRMAEKLSQLPDAAMIGPKVIGLDGHLQSPDPYMSFWKRHIWRYWSNLFLSKKRKSKVFMDEYSDHASEGFHYRLSGSFFMMNASDFFACGEMDPATFLYSEELILSERLKRIGKKVYYYPEVSVVHEHGFTTTRYFDKVRIREMMFESECYYYRTYIGTPMWQIKLARITYSLKRKLGR